MALNKGDDKVITFYLQDDDCNPIVIDDLIGVIIFISQHETVLKKYSTNVLAGYDPIEIVDSANGIVSINFKRSVVANAPLQKVKATVKIATENTDFENNEFLTTDPNIEIDLLEDTLTKDITVFE